MYVENTYGFRPAQNSTAKGNLSWNTQKYRYLCLNRTAALSWRTWLQKTTLTIETFDAAFAKK